MKVGVQQLQIQPRRKERMPMSTLGPSGQEANSSWRTMVFNCGLILPHTALQRTRLGPHDGTCVRFTWRLKPRSSLWQFAPQQSHSQNYVLFSFPFSFLLSFPLVSYDRATIPTLHWLPSSFMAITTP